MTMTNKTLEDVFYGIADIEDLAVTIKIQPYRILTFSKV